MFFILVKLQLFLLKNNLRKKIGHGHKCLHPVFNFLFLTLLKISYEIDFNMSNLLNFELGSYIDSQIALQLFNGGIDAITAHKQLLALETKELRHDTLMASIRKEIEVLNNLGISLLNILESTYKV